MSDGPERAAETRRSVLAAFGLPPDAPYGRLTMTGAPAGAVRYEAALIHPDGREAPATTATEATREAWPTPYVITFYGLFGPGPWRTAALPGIPVVLLWPLRPGPAPDETAPPPMAWLWATVRYGTSPVYGLARTHPDGGLTEELGGLEHQHNKIERERAYRGLAHLRRKIQRESAPLPAEEFLSQCEQAAVALWLGGDRALTPKALYTTLGWGHSRFYQLLADYRAQNYPWAANARALCSRLEQHAERELRRRRQAGIPDSPDR